MPYTALLEYLPSNILFKHKKPFTAPIDYWLKSNLKEEVYDLFHCSTYLTDLGINKKSLELLTSEFYNSSKDYSRTIWGFFLLLKWYQKFVNSNLVS